MNQADPINLLTRIVEGSPVIVLLLLVIGTLIWRTWRVERNEMLAELREEREARALAHREMIAVAERGIQSSLAVERALIELRNAIREK
jgi:hypothetical protein